MLLLNVVTLFSSVPKLHFQNFQGRYVRKSWRISVLNWDKFVCAVMASRKAMIDCTVRRKLMLLVKWIRGSYIRSKSVLNVIVASLV